MTRARQRLLKGVLALGLAGALVGAAIYVVLFHPLILAGRSDIVRVDGGDIQGLEWRGLSIYRGIPFAAPPVGDNRWRAPQAIAPWGGVRDATRFADVCMQSG